MAAGDHLAGGDHRAADPAFAMRLDTSDAGNDPANVSTRQAFDLLAAGFGPGFNGPLLIVAELPTAARQAALPALRDAMRARARRRRGHAASDRARRARSP